VSAIPLPVSLADTVSAGSEDERKAALAYLSEAWEEARLEGIDGDCLAQVALFTAIHELVSTYGEDATARFAEGLGERIRRGEFSLPPLRQKRPSRLFRFKQNFSGGHFSLNYPRFSLEKSESFQQLG
jgi:hypothetical protein